jgi:hypothetical protein
MRGGPAAGLALVEAILSCSELAGYHLAHAAQADLYRRLGQIRRHGRAVFEIKELTGRFAVIQSDSVEDAIEWSKRFRKIVGDGESEIVPIMGPQ